MRFYRGFQAVTATIVFGKIHFLLISEKEFFHEIKCNGMTSFMEFMNRLLLKIKILNTETRDKSYHNTFHHNKLMMSSIRMLFISSLVAKLNITLEIGIDIIQSESWYSIQRKTTIRFVLHEFHEHLSFRHVLFHDKLIF